MQIRQISIFVENKPGTLSRICRVLADAEVNLAALSLADTSDFGIVRMIVDDHEKAKTALSAMGLAANVSGVVAVCVPDRPGGMAGVMEALDSSGTNIEYSYAMNGDSRTGKAVLLFRFSDNDKAEEALKAAGYTTRCEKDLNRPAL